MKKKIIIAISILSLIVLFFGVKLIIDKIELSEKQVSINYNEDLDLNSLVKKHEGGELKIEGSFDKTKVGDYEIIYKVIDKDGLEKKEKVIIKVEDKEKPVISVTNNKVNVSLNSNVDLMKDVKAIDNYDNDLTNKIKVTGSVDTSKVGSYEVKYNVSDSSGNKADEVTRTYVVEEIFKVNTSKEYRYDAKDHFIVISFDKNNKVYSSYCVRDGGCMSEEGKYSVNGNTINATYTFGYHLAREVDGEKINIKETYTLIKDGLKEKDKVYKLK